MSDFFFNGRGKIPAALIILFLLSPGSPARATTSRINSLGGNGDYFEDDANTTRWYGSLTDYPDQVVLQTGDFNIPDGYWLTGSTPDGGPGLGLHLGLGQDNHWGTAAFVIQSQADDRSQHLFENRSQESLSLIYAKDFGALSAALLYRFGGWKSVAEDQIQYHENTFGAGVRVDLGPSAYLDLAGEIRDTNLEGTTPPEGFAQDPQNNFGLRSRGFIALGKRTALIPVMDFIREDHNDAFLTYDPQQAIRQEAHLFSFGLGLNHYPDTDHLLLLSAEYLDGSREENRSDLSQVRKQNWTALTIRTGFESRITSWLTTRGSVALVDFSLDEDWQTAANSDVWESDEDPIVRINLGAAIHIGPADLDLAFGERFPETRYQGRLDLPRKHWLSATARLLF